MEAMTMTTQLNKILASIFRITGPLCFENCPCFLRFVLVSSSAIFKGAAGYQLWKKKGIFTELVLRRRQWPRKLFCVSPLSL